MLVSNNTTTISNHSCCWLGVALLSGFGDSNATSSSSNKQEATDDGGKLLEGEGTAEDKLEEDQKLLAMRERQLAKEYKTEFNARRQVNMITMDYIIVYRVLM